MSLRVVPVRLRDANRLVELWHRHHLPAKGHRWSIGVTDETGLLHGAAIVGRVVARLAGHHSAVAEVLRLVTDGTPNACSILYGAAARAAKDMGFARIQTYILEEEDGTSLKAAGWIEDRVTRGDTWDRPGRPREDRAPTTPKRRWYKDLNPPGPEPVLPDELLAALV